MLRKSELYLFTSVHLYLPSSKKVIVIGIHTEVQLYSTVLSESLNMCEPRTFFGPVAILVTVAMPYMVSLVTCGQLCFPFRVPSYGVWIERNLVGSSNHRE